MIKKTNQISFLLKKNLNRNIIVTMMKIEF